MAEREVEVAIGSDRCGTGTGSSLYGATDSAASSGRADDESLSAGGGGGGDGDGRDGGGGGESGRDAGGGSGGSGVGGSGTDLEVEGVDLEAGLADGGAASVAAAAAAAVAAAAAGGDGVGGVEAPGAGGGKKGKKDKKDKKPKKPQMKDDIKTSMASERTFFKWIWTGFHIGGVGTFILGFFSADRGFGRLSLVAFTWLVAFAGIFYGLNQFYRRRRALRAGLLEPENWENPHAPAIVVGMFTVVIVSVLVFAVVTA